MRVRVRIKNVHCVTVKGKRYFYHRPTKTRLLAPYGSPQFIEEVNALNVKHSRYFSKKRTLGTLIAEYRNAPEFRDLRNSTQRNYDWHLKYLSGVGDTPISAIDTQYCIAIRDLVYADHKRIKANMAMTMLGILWRFGRPRGLTKGVSPTEDVRSIPRPKKLKKQNRAWTDAEFSTFIENCSPALRTAVVLARYTAVRQGDIAVMEWSAYDGQRILVVQEKTGESVWVKAHPEVKRLLDSLPRRGATIVADPKGKPLKSLAQTFSQQKKRLHHKIGFSLDPTFHGLRTTVATALADSGADERTIAGVTGHRDLKSVRIYTEEANRRKANERAVDMLVSVKRTSKQERLQ